VDATTECPKGESVIRKSRTELKRIGGAVDRRPTKKEQGNTALKAKKTFTRQHNLRSKDKSGTISPERGEQGLKKVKVWPSLSHTQVGKKWTIRQQKCSKRISGRVTGCGRHGTRRKASFCSFVPEKR